MHELTHLPDDALLRAVSALVARDRATTASLLAHLAEVDTRRLYLALGHPSMFAYAVEALHLSESAAYRRIHAARAVRRFPRLLALVASGELHLAAICVLAPHFTDELCAELVTAATHRSKAQVERWLATRFAPTLLVEPIDAPPQLVLGRVAVEAPASLAAAGTDTQLVPGRVESPEVVACLAPAPAPPVVVRLPLPEATYAKLRHAQALLAHAVPDGDVAQVVDRALDALIERLERRKFAAISRPRRAPAAAPARPAMRPRTVPAQVKRAVWQRDQGRCAFVSGECRRCSARARLEFDHVTPVARGGTARAEGMRLLCRAHNQFEAQRVFGRVFMERKREIARAARSTRPGTSCGVLDRATTGQHPPATPDPTG